MGQLFKVFTLAWDNENGCGCDVFTTERARDEAHREALLSFLNGHHGPFNGADASPIKMSLVELIKLDERHDFTRGARYTLGAYDIEIEAGLSLNNHE